MDHTLLAVLILIAVALVFDFINGFLDAANSIATVVSTRVLSPGKAVIWAAFFNFAAAFGFGVGVAKTVGSGMVDLSSVDNTVIFAGLCGAIVWNIFTWFFGLPTSSSHALIGGYAGSAVSKGGFGVIIASGWTKTLAFIVLSPIIGMILGFILMAITMWIVKDRAPRNVDNGFRKLQLVSAAAYSLGHGTNDAQKTMGIILAVQIAAGMVDPKTKEPNNYVVYACHLAMGLGTLMGGWRIVKTMGQKICHLQPVHGFSAETGGALCLYGATWLGIPVSTTHTITGAIVGVGSTRGPRAVAWGVAGRVVWAWILTIPAAAVIAAGSWWVFSLLGWR